MRRWQLESVGKLSRALSVVAGVWLLGCGGSSGLGAPSQAYPSSEAMSPYGAKSCVLDLADKYRACKKEEDAQKAASSAPVREKSSAMRVADEYFEAYLLFDLERMDSFYSRDAVFYDPTAEMWGEDGFHWHGKTEIMAGMREVVAEYNPTMQFFMREKYESAGHVVYSGKVKAITESGGVLEVVCAAVTTIITVKAGKVVEHRDYVDYTIYENSDWAENLGCGN